MSKRQKRFERIRRNHSDVSFEQLRQILEDYGFQHKNTSGSHYSFSYILKGKMHVFVVPFRRPLKMIYVKNAIKLIESIIQEQGEDNNDES